MSGGCVSTVLHRRLGHGLALALALACLSACNPEVVATPVGFLEVRGPAGQVTVGTLRAEITGGRARLIGMGPPPYTVTWEGPDARVTVLEVPGPTLDLQAMLLPPPIRGDLIDLDIRPSVDGAMAVVLVAGDQVFAAEPVAGGFHGLAPRGVPTDIVALFARDGRAVALGRRRLPDPALASQPLAIAPGIPLDGRLAVRLETAPAGVVTGELTLHGLRTGLILGSGLADRLGAVALPRPDIDALPEGGVWLEAQARDPGEAEPRLITAAHALLGTEQATLPWPQDAEVRPRPSAPAVAPVLTADQRRLRFLPGDAAWVEVVIEASNSCLVRRPWRIFAPAAAGEVLIPRLEADALTLPALQTQLTLHTLPGLTYADLLAGDAPPAVRWPRTAQRATRQTTRGTLRGGDTTCTPTALRGDYRLVEAGLCTGQPARTLTIGPCGDLLPLDGAGDLCGATAEDLQPDGDTLRLGDAQLLRPADPTDPTPAVLVGDWHRVDVTQEHWTATPDGRRGQPLDDPARIEAAADGPYLRFEPNGRFRLRTRYAQLDGALQTFDGLTGTLEADPDDCGARHPVPLDLTDGTLTLDRWTPDGRGAGTRQIVRIRRQ